MGARLQNAQIGMANLLIGIPPASMQIGGYLLLASVRQRLLGTGHRVALRLALCAPGPIDAWVSCLEAGCFVRSACGVAWLVGVSARSGELAALDDQVLLADRPVLKPAFEDLAGARGVACLRRQRRPGDVRGHAMVRHRAPRVIPGRRLGEPDITGV